MGKALLLAGSLVCCASDPPTQETAQAIYTRDVFPVLHAQCTSNTSGCHSASSATVLVIADPAQSYTVITTQYAGNFDDTAPLLNVHPLIAPLGDGARSVIEAWFAQERAERGL
jgi:hypothetical protein